MYIVQISRWGYEVAGMGRIGEGRIGGVAGV